MSTAQVVNRYPINPAPIPSMYRNGFNPTNPTLRASKSSSPRQLYSNHTRSTLLLPDDDDADDIEQQSPPRNPVFQSSYSGPYSPNNHAIRQRLRRPIRSIESKVSKPKPSPSPSPLKSPILKRSFRKFPSYSTSRRHRHHHHHHQQQHQQSKPFGNQWIKMVAGGCLFVFAVSIYYLYGDLLTFSSLKQNHHSIIEFIDRYPISSPLIFMTFECIVVGLTIPGATVLSMAAGLFFDQPMASFYAWFGCGSGAFFCYLSVRFICADFMKSCISRYSSSATYKAFERGVQRNELLYLIYVRYIIVIPFWLVNVAAALFGCRVHNFVISTFVATIPGALLLTTAGRGLAKAFQQYHEEITPFGLVKQVLWSRDMLFCGSLLALCLSIPFVLRKCQMYQDQEEEMSEGDRIKMKDRYRNDFVDSSDSENEYIIKHHKDL